MNFGFTIQNRTAWWWLVKRNAEQKNHKHKLQKGWKFLFRTTEHQILSGNIFQAGCKCQCSKINKYLTAPDHTNNNDRLR